MSKQTWGPIAILLFVICLLNGCKYKFPKGHFEGNLLERRGDRYFFEPVHLDVSYTPLHEANIVVTNAAKVVLASASVSQPRKNEIYLTLSGIQKGIYLLHRIPEKPGNRKDYCYAGVTDINIDLCYCENGFLLKFRDQAMKPIFTLSGNLFKKESPFPFENPKSIALSDAIEEAFTRNFDSKIAIENMLQARSTALAAWLNLLPHVSLSLIWLFPVPDYVSLISGSQNLTPFLMPTTWAAVKEAGINAKIQEAVLTISQANLASNLEQLFYAYERDSKIILAHERIQELLRRFGKRPGLNPLLIEIIEKWISLIEGTKRGVDRVLDEDRYAISQTMGMHNPDGISGIQIGPEFETIEDALPINGRILGDWSSQRSFEIEQLDYLTDIAEMKKITMYFEWLSSSASDTRSLGFALIGEQRIAKSTLRELATKREQMKCMIYHNAYLLALDYNGALATDRKLKKPLPLSLILLELSGKLEEIAKTEKLEAETITSWIQGTLAESVQYESNLAAYRIARAKKDRFILSGNFERLLPQLQNHVLR